MAKLRAHNERAGRGGGSGGASWISYSDMMASLLLVFVLVLVYSLYQYFTMLETKTAELDAQTAIVSQQQITLDEQTITLAAQQTVIDSAKADLEEQRVILTDKQAELDAANASLADKETELSALQAQLDDQVAILAQQQTTLDAQSTVLAQQKADLANATAQLQAQQDAMTAQANKIDALVGVRTEIIQQLSTALSQSGLKANVDPNTGDIVLDSAVFFETGSYNIKTDGRAMLDTFIPIYLSVLLKDEYKDYLGEIIIEGHTDTQGEYFMNLQLSQSRALSVAQYCLQLSSLTAEQRVLLRTILTATGRSFSDPIYASDGSVDMERSRRVEFKFSLRDAEMIDEMNRLLSEAAATEAPAAEPTEAPVG